MQTRFSEGEVAPQVNSLAEAILAFEAKMTVRKLQDIMLNKARVGVLYIDEADEQKYLLTYKRERYLHFGDHFPAIPESREAIIANIKLVYWCAMERHNLAALFPSRACYSTKGQTFWDFYEKWNTEHPKLKGEICLPMNRWTKLF